jgi:4-diphosphocytidyl-2-C-methyl-D-erythritol kinase
MDTGHSSRRPSDNDQSSIHFTPAKLNVLLKVTGRRPDGYHELVSIMAPVGLYDRLELQMTSDKRIKVSCRGFSAPSNEENLVCRAARAFFAKTGIDDGVSIELTKNIPVAAGLGGGSSDAACVLKALNRNYAFPLTAEELAQLALALGADVPFFLVERPCIARGIGEILEPIENWPQLWYVIITPPIRVSTAWVYGRLNIPPASSELELTNEAYQYIIINLKKRPLGIGPILENDLERVTADRFPVIKRIKLLLAEAGADGALMSGSGPSVFGLFQSRDTALRAKAALADSHLGDMFLVQGLA